MVNTRSEDTILFIGLTPKIFKFKLLYKMLPAFAEKKQSIDFSDRFNLILFQDSGPVYLEDFTFEFKNLIKLLKEYESKIVRANIAGGIFVAATFVIDVYKKISDKVFRLIIFTDKGSLKIPNTYIPVLNDLLDKVKDIPLFIDILRIGTNDYEEDLKLKQIANKCGGDIHEIKTAAQLQDTLLRLAEKKIIRQESFIGTKSASIITPDNEKFFINLADDPKILITSETCSICFKKDDKTVVQCPNCDTIAHMSCWAHWAKTTSIGIPYVFRCHNCFNLVKLNPEFVEIVQTGKAPIIEAEPKRIDLTAYLRMLEEKRKPQIIQENDPLEIPADEYEDISEQITFNEKEIADSDLWDIEFRIPSRPTSQTQKLNEKNLDLQPIPLNLNEVETNNQSNIVQAPALTRKISTQSNNLNNTLGKQNRTQEITVVFCPSCSAINSSKDKRCKRCGHLLF
ncbi:MAG: hypothetical protein ACTSQP_01800 [Promethearchaeota archaeon]